MNMNLLIKIFKKITIFIVAILAVFILYLVALNLKYSYWDQPELIKQCVQAGNSLDICQGRFD